MLFYFIFLFRFSFLFLAIYDIITAPFHVISCLFHCKIFPTGLLCVAFGSIPGKAWRFQESFSTGQVVHSTAKIMFTFKLWLISYYKIFNCKHWTNVTPVGPQPRKKLQKTRVRHFSRQFFKTLSQSSQQSSCCHFIWIDENKLNIQFPQNSKVCVFKFWSLFLLYVMTDKTT